MKRVDGFVVWLFMICFSLSGTSMAAEICSAQSGNWGVASTWEGGVVPSAADAVTIQSGDTVILESGGKSCLHLKVEAGGMLYANNSSTGSNPRYLYIYGDIQCDGTIGNGETYDLIGFNVEGDSCRITGSGSFNASRIRKYLNDADTTTLFIRRNVTLRVGGTALYNNRSGTVFQVIIEAGDTLNATGDGTTSGNIAIDGVNGAASSTGGGSVTVQGVLLISGILYLTNSNSSNPVSIIITGTGCIETASISCPNSGASGHTFTIEDGGVLNLTSADWGEIGFVNNTYNFLPGSLVIYSGDTAQTVGNPADYSSLTLSGSGHKRILTDMVIGGNLGIEPDAVLDIAAGTSVTASGNCSLAGAGCLLLRSPADSSSPASFIPLGGVTGTGTVQIERWIKKYTDPSDSRFHLLSSPVTNQDIQPGFVADPPAAGSDFYRWDEPMGCWINSKDITGNWNSSFQPGDDRHFLPGRGYLVAYQEDEMTWFSGSLNVSDLSPSITLTEGEFEGFNLIGNPFSSALNAEIDHWDKSNVANAVWVWDGEAGNYKSWNGNVGNLNNGSIPAMQGFFVQAIGPAPLLTIPASSRVHALQPFYKTDIPNMLQVKLIHGTKNDGICLALCDPARAGYDPSEDVAKFFGAADAPQLFWIVDDTYLSITVCPPDDSGLTLPMGIIACEDGMFRMEIEGQESFSCGGGSFLVDHQEDITVNLQEVSEYSFYAAKGFDPSRFVIRIGFPDNITGRLPDKSVTIHSWHNRIILRGLEKQDGAATVHLFDLSGKLVLTANVSVSCPVVETSLPEGIYFATVDLSGDHFSEKLFLESPWH